MTRDPLLAVLCLTPFASIGLFGLSLLTNMNQNVSFAVCLLGGSLVMLTAFGAMIRHDDC